MFSVIWRWLKRSSVFWYFFALALLSVVYFCSYLYTFKNKRHLTSKYGQKYKVYVVGDALYQYTMLHSMGMDLDMDIRNNRKLIGDPWGIGNKVEKKYGLPTFKYGYHKWAVGDAFLKLPFFWLGQAISSRVYRHETAPYYHDGRSQITQALSNFASLFYAFLGLLLAFFIVRRELGTGPALAGCGLIWVGSSLTHYWSWYSSYQHAISFFTTTLLFSTWYFWFYCPARAALAQKQRLRFAALPSRWAYLLAGLAGGLNAIVRMENAPLPAIFVVPLLMQIALLRPHAKWRLFWRFFLRWCWLPLGYVMLLSIQLGYWYWNTGHIFINHSGASYFRFSQPYLMELWFSPRNGMLPYNPAFLLAFLGVFYMLRKHLLLCLVFLAVFMEVSILNSSSTYYWGGYSYGVRRAVAIYFVFMLWTAAAFRLLWVSYQRFPRATLTLLFAPQLVLFVIYPHQLMVRHAHYSRFERPGQIIPGDLKKLFQKLGNPLSFPHNAYFAWKHDVPMSRYEKLVSTYPLMIHSVQLKKGFRAAYTIDFRDWRRLIYFTRGFRFKYRKARARERLGVHLPKGKEGRLLLPIHYNRLCYRFDFSYKGEKGCRVFLRWNHHRQKTVRLAKDSQIITYQPGFRQRSHGVNDVDLRATCPLLVRSVRLKAWSIPADNSCSVAKAK